jgi:hypothetical protein
MSKNIQNVVAHLAKLAAYPLKPPLQTTTWIVFRTHIRCMCTWVCEFRSTAWQPSPHEIHLSLRLPNAPLTFFLPLKHCFSFEFFLCRMATQLTYQCYGTMRRGWQVPNGTIRGVHDFQMCNARGFIESKLTPPMTILTRPMTIHNKKSCTGLNTENGKRRKK